APEGRGKFLLWFGLVSWGFSLAFLGLALGSLFFFLGDRWGPAGIAGVGLLAAVTLPNLFRGLGGGASPPMLRPRHKKAVGRGLALGGRGGVLLFPVEDRVGAPFQLRPGTRAELRAEVSGFIRELYFDEGDAVPCGRPVARLSIPDLGSRIAQKRAELREVEARLYLLQEGTRAEVVAAQRARVERARAWGERARQDLERNQQSLQADLARLDKLIDQYEAELDYARSVYARNSRLFWAKAVGEEVYQETGKKRRVSLATL